VAATGQLNDTYSKIGREFLKTKLVIAAVATVALQQPAMASPLLLIFSATNFNETHGIAAPPEPVVQGSIVFDAPDIHSYPTLISAISLSIDGHVYTAAEMGGTLLNGAYQVPGVNIGYIFGGTLDGVNTVGSGQNDFFIQITDFIDPSCPALGCYAPKMGYSTSNFSPVPDTFDATHFWLSTDLTWTLSPYSAPLPPGPGNNAPEPGSVWLALLGLVGLWAAGRASKQVRIPINPPGSSGSSRPACPA